MKQEDFFKSSFFSFGLGLVLFFSIIKIAEGGYHTGQWLYRILH